MNILYHHSYDDVNNTFIIVIVLILKSFKNRWCLYIHIQNHETKIQF